jgi:hypothetical protein
MAELDPITCRHTLRDVARAAAVPALCCVATMLLVGGHARLLIALFTVANAPLIVSLVQTRRRWLRLDEQGITQFDNGRRQFAAWTDKLSVSWGERPDRPDEHEYSVWVQDREVIKFDSDFVGHAEVFQLIEERIAEAQYPGLRAALESGQCVSFGRVRLNHSRFWLGGSSLGLADSKLVIRRGLLSVRRRSPDQEYLCLRSTQVRNMSLLLRLVAELQGDAEGESTVKLRVA